MAGLTGYGKFSGCCSFSRRERASILNISWKKCAMADYVLFDGEEQFV